MALTESRFNMWRVVVSLVHADGRIDDNEVKMINHYLNKLELSEEQKSQLENEINNPRNVDSLLPRITEPADRSLCIYFARLLLWADGVLDPSEEKILEKMNTSVLEKTDIQSINEKLARQKPPPEKKGIKEVFESFFNYLTK